MESGHFPSGMHICWTQIFTQTTMNHTTATSRFQLSADVKKTLFDFLDALTKHKSFAQKSKLLGVLAESTQKNAWKKLSAVRNCGAEWIFELNQHKQSGEQAFTGRAYETCKHKFCSFCNWRKSRKVLLELLAICAYYKAQVYPGLEFSFVTLTFPNPPIDKVRECYLALSKAYPKLFKDKQIAKNFLGSFAGVEYVGDHTKSGEAHVHLHCLLAHLGCKDKRYWQPVFTSVWERALRWDKSPLRRGDYHLQVDFKSCFVKQSVLKKLENQKELNNLNKDFLSVMAGVMEVVKYVVAPATIEKMTKKDIKDLIKQTKGLRSFRTSGIFYKFKWEDTGFCQDDFLKIIFKDYKDFSAGDWEVIATFYALWNAYDEQFYLKNSCRQDVEFV